MSPSSDRQDTIFNLSACEVLQYLLLEYVCRMAVLLPFASHAHSNSLDVILA